jgi:Plant transposon protein
MKLPGGYEVNGVRRDRLMYLFADGMYPSWAIFCGPNHSPMNLKEKYFSKRQEATRKNVERLLGFIQGRFNILRREWLEWDINFILQFSEVCAILHNMLVELRRDGKLDDEFDANGNRIPDESAIQEFMELPAEGLEENWCAEYGFTNVMGGT